MLLLFSHQLTQQQEKEAIQRFGVKHFLSLPEDLQELWSDMPADIEELDPTLDVLKTFIKRHTKDGDIVLIQGDFGATYNMVQYCKSLKLKTVYATTKRVSTMLHSEKEKYIKKAQFEHRRFREYGV